MKRIEVNGRQLHEAFFCKSKEDGLAPRGDGTFQITGLPVRCKKPTTEEDRLMVVLDLGRNEAHHRKSGREGYKACLQLVDGKWVVAKWDPRWTWGTALTLNQWEGVLKGIGRGIQFWRTYEYPEVKQVLEVLFSSYEEKEVYHFEDTKVRLPKPILKKQ